MTKLTIAIPTFNRANRLEKSLRNLLQQVKSSGFSSDLEILVSDNGSDDDTQQVILALQPFFIKIGVAFTHIENDENLGVDENIRRCYQSASGDYVWFVSDDDNLYTDSISSVMSELANKSVGAIFFNFNQTPYGLDSPLIKERVKINTINEDNIACLKNVYRWPKLTAMVVKNIDLSLALHENLFTHIEIFMRVVLKVGGFVSSPKFIAYPDDDFMDHIDFVPYVGNWTNKQLRIFLTEVNLSDSYETLCIPELSVLGISLQWLGAYYRDKFKLNDSLRAKLWQDVYKELRWKNINKGTLWELFKFSLSITLLRRTWR